MLYAVAMIIGIIIWFCIGLILGNSISSLLFYLSAWIVAMIIYSLTIDRWIHGE